MKKQQIDLKGIKPEQIKIRFKAGDYFLHEHPEYNHPCATIVLKAPKRVKDDSDLIYTARVFFNDECEEYDKKTKSHIYRKKWVIEKDVMPYYEFTPAVPVMQTCGSINPWSEQSEEGTVYKQEYDTLLSIMKEFKKTGKIDEEMLNRYTLLDALNQ